MPNLTWWLIISGLYVCGAAEMAARVIDEVPMWRIVTDGNAALVFTVAVLLWPATALMLFTVTVHDYWLRRRSYR